MLQLGMVPKQQDPGKLYYQALKHYEQKQWGKAEPLFSKALQLLSARKAPSKNPKAKHYLTLGRCDIMYLLARIAQSQNKASKACIQLQTLQKAIQTVPLTWPKWKVNPTLIERMTDAKARLKRCQATQPSILVFTDLPPGTQVELQKITPKSPKPNWQKITLPLRTLQTNVTIRVTSPNHLPKTVTVKLKQWQRNERKLALLPRPIRKAPPSRPKIIKPPPKKVIPTWLWVTIAGVGIAGTATAVILIATQSGKDEKAELVLKF